MKKHGWIWGSTVVLVLATPLVIIALQPDPELADRTTPDRFVADLLKARNETKSYQVYARKLQLYIESFQQMPWAEAQKRFSNPPFKIVEQYDDQIHAQVTNASFEATPEIKFEAEVRVRRNRKSKQVSWTLGNLSCSFNPSKLKPDPKLGDTLLASILKRSPYQTIALDFPDQGLIELGYYRNKGKVSQVWDGHLQARIMLTRIDGPAKESTRIQYTAPSELEYVPRPLIASLPYPKVKRSRDAIGSVTAEGESGAISDSNLHIGQLVRRGYKPRADVDFNENPVGSLEDLKLLPSESSALCLSFTIKWPHNQAAMNDLERFRRLEKLYTAVDKATTLPFLERQSSLKHVLVVGEPFDLGRLLKNKNLETLHVKYSGPKPTDEQMAGLAKLRSLKDLRLVGFEPGPKTIAAIASLPNLETLWLVGGKLKGHRLSSLHKLKKLTSLAGDFSLDFQEDRTFLSGFESLEHLVLQRTRVHPEALSKVTARGKLKSLMLFYVDGLTDQNLGMLTSLPKLDLFSTVDSKITVHGLDRLKPKLSGKFEGP